MDLVVCIKRVPDSAARIKVAADGRTIETAGVEHVISPYDEMALEKALQLREQHGGTVTAVLVGPAAAAKELRQALAMGADAAVHVKDEAADRDPLSTAKILARAVSARRYDAILCGRQSIDADNGAVGVMLAVLLDVPAVTLVTKLEVADGKAVAHREAERGTEVCEVALPALFTAQRGLAEPRYPSIKGIMAAKKKAVEEMEPAAEEATAVALDRLEPPPARKGGRIVGEGPEAVAELVRLLREEAKVL